MATKKQRDILKHNKATYIERNGNVATWRVTLQDGTEKTVTTNALCGPYTAITKAIFREATQ